jgi:hypothetical protein
MLKPIHLFFASILFCFIGNVTLAQTIERSVVASAAETLLGPNPANFTLSYVLGEVVGDLLPNPANSLFLTTGFVQPDDDLQVILNRDISKSILLYPNPASGNTVKLAFNNLPDGIYIIDIIDPIGRVLKTQTVTYQNNNFFYLPLDISQFKGGTYFIRVNNGVGFNGSVKLIKI